MKKTLTINGSGDILLQNNKDQLKYLINKTDKRYNFKNTLIINNNPLVLDFLNFEKDEKEKNGDQFKRKRRIRKKNRN